MLTSLFLILKPLWSELLCLKVLSLSKKSRVLTIKISFHCACSLFNFQGPMPPSGSAPLTLLCRALLRKLRYSITPFLSCQHFFSLFFYLFSNPYTLPRVPMARNASGATICCGFEPLLTRFSIFRRFCSL